MPRPLLLRQAALSSLVAVLSTVNAALSPTTFNVVLAVLWWCIAALAYWDGRRTAAKKRAEARRETDV